MPLRARLLILLAALCLGAPSKASAGGGPENVLLVINSQSAASRTIANHYIRLRRIPAENVMYLPWDPNEQTTTIDAFREKILVPVVFRWGSRFDRSPIDYIVYSSDFPWLIDAQADVERCQRASRDAPQRWPKERWPIGSLTGLTYLYQSATESHANPVYLERRINFYMRRAIPEQADAPTIAFDSHERFGPHGERQGPWDATRRSPSYLLSSILGVTADHGNRGNSVTEIIACLERSTRADATHPAGTIYFVANRGIRSRVREQAFPAAVKELRRLGVRAEILHGDIPRNKNDVQGLMTGIADFDWAASGSTILPGAFCDNLTSLGGDMDAKAGQTPLSEFLRFGAAAASGTVDEPLAIQDKFPLALCQVHYARGCSLAEAFYQSVYGPYQLLLVGDPLCQPWARQPQVSVTGIEPGAIVKGELTITPLAANPEPGRPVDHFELFDGGVRLGECKPGENLELATTRLVDGYHELRIVAVESGPIRSQGRRIVPITVANHDGSVEFRMVSIDKADNGAVVVAAHCPTASKIEILQNADLKATIRGPEGKAHIRLAVLGSGPVRLTAVAYVDGFKIVSPPLDLTLP